MSGTLETISHLVASDTYRVSNHAYEELEKDGILPTLLVECLKTAVVVEDYPDAKRGPSVLVLCSGPDLPPTHALWGLHRLNPAIAVLITAYIPDVNVWSSDLMTRKGK